MYSWLLQYCSRPLANVVIFLWYLFLLLLVIYTIDMQPGRFRYLRW